jgi:O-antigen/teichoic acid export membrane protein
VTLRTDHRPIRARLEVLSKPLQDGLFRSALRAGGWTLGGNVVGRLATALSTLFAAAILGSRGYGELSLVQTTALAVTSVSALGLPLATTKLVAEARAHARRRTNTLIGTALLMTAVTGVTVLAGYCLLSPIVARIVFDQQVAVIVLLAAAPLLLLSPLNEVLAGILTGLEQFPRLGAFQALRGVLVGTALSCGAALGISIGGLLLAIVLAELISCTVGWSLLLRLRSPLRLELAEIWRCTRPLLRVSLPAMVAGISLLPALWLGQVMLSRQPDGLQKVGVFAVAYRWQLVAVFVPAVLGSVLLPMLGRLRASQRAPAAYQLFLRYGWFTLALAAPAGLALMVFARPIMALQGPQYATGAAILVVLGLGVVPAALNNVLSQRAVAESRLGLWVASDIAQAGALIFTAWLLVPSLDGVGLAWAYVAAFVATCLVLIPILSPDRRGLEP